MLNLTRLHLGIAHESQFQGLGISSSAAVMRSWCSIGRSRKRGNSVRVTPQAKCFNPGKNANCHTLVSLTLARRQFLGGVLRKNSSSATRHQARLGQQLVAWNH